MCFKQVGKTTFKILHIFTVGLVLFHECMFCAFRGHFLLPITFCISCVGSCACEHCASKYAHDHDGSKIIWGDIVQIPMLCRGKLLSVPVVHMARQTWFSPTHMINKHE